MMSVVMHGYNLHSTMTQERNMLVTFKSAAAADVLMFGESARGLFQVLGKDTSAAQGIITVQQLPDAIARLERAIEEDKARDETDAAQDDNGDEADEGKPRGIGAPVSFAQRAWPLLEMMQLSLNESKPVTWGT